jgi:PAT family beta-lactamase induction signal transducer AmpG
MTFQDYLDIFRNRRIGAMLTLGFASGLPLALTSGTLQAWMTVEGLDIKTIGFFSLVGQAYIFKFLWAPLMDRFTPPLLGRRRGWLLVTQLGLVGGIAAMAFCPPHEALWALAALATLVAFLSASQDIVFDAYSTDVLRPPSAAPARRSRCSATGWRCWSRRAGALSGGSRAGVVTCTC